MSSIECNKDITESDVKTVEIILTHQCKNCKEFFAYNELLYAVGHPYYILLHKKCLPFFNYSEGWPHDKSKEYYKR